MTTVVAPVGVAMPSIPETVRLYGNIEFTGNDDMRMVSSFALDGVSSYPDDFKGDVVEFGRIQ